MFNRDACAKITSKPVMAFNFQVLFIAPCCCVVVVQSTRSNVGPVLGDVEICAQHSLKSLHLVVRGRVVKKWDGAGQSPFDGASIPVTFTRDDLYKSMAARDFDQHHFGGLHMRLLKLGVVLTVNDVGVGGVDG